MLPPLRTALASLLVLVACTSGAGTDDNNNNNNNNNNGDGPNGHGTMSAKIDGTSWSGSVAVAALYSAGILAISGSDAAFTSFTFALPVSAPGTFSVAGTLGTNASLQQPSKQWTAAGTDGGGSITVTSLTATGAAGTFEFSLVPAAGTTGTKGISQGKFNVKF